jgi:hypothetical protein
LRKFRAKRLKCFQKPLLIHTASVTEGAARSKSMLKHATGAMLSAPAVSMALYEIGVPGAKR